MIEHHDHRYHRNEDIDKRLTSGAKARSKFDDSFAATVWSACRIRVSAILIPSAVRTNAINTYSVAFEYSRNLKNDVSPA